jgi:hypothetical protein
MTQASVTRLDKKLGNKKKPQHASQSFAQMVSGAQLKALQPYIQQQVALAAQQMVGSIYQTMMSERAMMQTRQLAFERLLTKNTTWFNDEVLAMAVADVEDESAGMVSTEGPIAEGDKVRLEFAAQPSDAKEFSPMSKLAVHAVGRKNQQGTVQTHPELETNLVGMKVGDVKEFLIAEPVQEGKEPENTRIKVQVIRISQPKKVAAAPATEVTQEETQSEQAPNA